MTDHRFYRDDLHGFRDPVPQGRREAALPLSGCLVPQDADGTPCEAVYAGCPGHEDPSSIWPRTVLPHDHLARHGPQEAPPSTQWPSGPPVRFTLGDTPQPLLGRDRGIPAMATLSHLLPSGDTVALTVHGATVEAVLAQVARALTQLHDWEKETPPDV